MSVHYTIIRVEARPMHDTRNVPLIAITYTTSPGATTTRAQYNVRAPDTCATTRAQTWLPQTGNLCENTEGHAYAIARKEQWPTPEARATIKPGLRHTYKNKQKTHAG